MSVLRVVCTILAFLSLASKTAAEDCAAGASTPVTIATAPTCDGTASAPASPRKFTLKPGVRITLRRNGGSSSISANSTPSSAVSCTPSALGSCTESSSFKPLSAAEEQEACTTAIAYLDPSSNQGGDPPPPPPPPPDFDDKLNAQGEENRCAGLVDAEDCKTVTEDECGTLVGFGTINVTSVCPVMCLCGGFAGGVDDGASPEASSSSSTVVIAAAAASVGAVVLMGIIMYFIMRRRSDSDDGSATVVRKLSNFTANSQEVTAFDAEAAYGGINDAGVDEGEQGGYIEVVTEEDTYGVVVPQKKSLFNRVVPAASEIYNVIANPLQAGLDAAETMDLESSLKKAAKHCGSLKGVYAKAAEFADKLDRTIVGHGATKMSKDAAATINVYTQETPLYGGMNGALGGYGKGGREALIHYYPYIKQLLAAMLPLEPLKGAFGEPVTLFRGVKLPVSQLLGDLKVGDTLTWWSFTSTTTTSDVLQSTDFLGIGKAGAKATVGKKRTVFHIKAFNGVNIKPFSAISNEDEVLLRPGSQFVIDGINEWHYGVTEVQMHQVPSTVMLMDQQGADEGVYDLPAEAAGDEIYSYDPIQAYMVPGHLQLGGGEVQANV